MGGGHGCQSTQFICRSPRTTINVVVVEIRGAVEMYLPGCLVMSNMLVGVVGTAGANSEKHIIEHLTGVEY
jgi:hypothetical protein